MYSLNTSQADRVSKSTGRCEMSTGADFHKQDSFAFEIEAEREYVHRLKMQRQKIETLYNKYDGLLQEMRKKDEKIRNQQVIADLSEKYNEFTMILPEIETIKKQNTQLNFEYEQTKYSLAQVEEAYHNVLSEQKNRIALSEEERFKAEDLTDQLYTKLKRLQQKVENKQVSFEKDRKVSNEKIESLKKQLHTVENKYISQISIINSELLRKQEELDILAKQNQRLRQLIVIEKQGNLQLSEENSQKITKLHHSYKTKIKLINKEIQELNYNNECLSSKITELKLQSQRHVQEISEMRNYINQEKKVSEESLYHIKFQGSQQRSIMRQEILQLSTKIEKLDKALGDSLRRQKQLRNHIQRLQDSEAMKKKIRVIEKRQMQKINRLLLLEMK